MASLHLNGATYKITRKMDAFKQMAVATKVSPLLASGLGELAPMLAALRSEGGFAGLPFDRLGQIVTPISRELAKMSEEDRRFIISECLMLLQRKDDGKEAWFPVWNVDARQSMFDEINTDFTMMLRLCGFVLQETFAAFLPASLSNMLGGAAA